VALDGFRNLLARLDPDPALAWQAYEELRKKLRAYFENNHLFDSDELAEEVLDRIAEKADVHALKNIAEFAFGVARNLRKEHLRQSSLRVELPTLEPFQDTRSGEDPETAMINRIDGKRKHECFRNCMGALSPAERDLIGRYFPPETSNLEEERRRFASYLGISSGALRTRMARIREKLEEEFERAYRRPVRMATHATTAAAARITESGQNAV
jgi:DNA-directed RNA polymerase specialized sigma24 family protein